MTDEHKSDTVTVKVLRQPFCKVTLETLASAALVAQAKKEAVKKVAKTVSVPGFRKGKAPENIILRSFGHAVREEWEKATANKAFKDVQDLVKVPLLNGNAQITFDMKKHSLDDGAEMTFSFETEPELPEVDYSKVTLETRPLPTIGKKEIDQTIQQILSYFGRAERISDRPAQEGDTVYIDVHLVKDDELSPVFNNTRFELTDGKMAEWMRDLVTGMKIGDAKDGVSKPDANATEEERKTFEPKNVRVTLIAIEKNEIPAFDDDIAKKLGVESADKARERIEALLQNQVNTEKQRGLREQVSRKLLEELAFDVPESAVARESEHRLSAQQKNDAFRKQWAGMNDEQKKEHRLKIAKESEEAIRLFYICRKIAQEEHIRVSREDLNQNVESTLDAMFADPALLNVEPGSEQESIALSRVMLDKVQDFVASKCNIVEAKPAAKKAETKKAPAKKAPAKKATTAAKKTPATEKKPAAKKKEPAAKKPAAKKTTTAAKKAAPKKKSS